MSTTDVGAVAGSDPPPRILLTDDAQADDNAPDTDMDMSPNPHDQQSDASSFGPLAPLLRETEKLDQGLTRKRKTPNPDLPNEDENAKRVRLGQDDVSRPEASNGTRVAREKKLPAEIWQHIFTFLPPKCLGRLLSVNKLFHNCLNPSPSANASSTPSTSPCLLPTMKPDAIWQASRRFFWPRMPAPLKSKSELDMWRLVCSPTCKFCSIRGQPQSPIPGDQWKRGPGAKGVSPIFPFFATSCGSCLAEKSIKVRNLA